MTISTKERELMVEALDKGENALARIYGKGVLMRRNEKESARQLIRSGVDVPMLVLKMVCMGLEYMYFCDNRQGEGIADILGKLANICGYHRCGMLMLEMNESA